MDKKTIIAFVLIGIILIAAACSPSQPETEIAGSAQVSGQEDGGAPEEPQEPAQAEAESQPETAPEDPETAESEDPTPIPVILEPGEVVHLVNGPLWLRISSPGDSAVVSVPEIEITGEASDGTVLTIGDEILLVEGSPEFSVTVSLDEGTNLIEFVASNYAGDGLSFYLIVIYDMIEGT